MQRTIAQILTVPATFLLIASVVLVTLLAWSYKPIQYALMLRSTACSPPGGFTEISPIWSST
jgi:hypothetical protein